MTFDAYLTVAMLAAMVLALTTRRASPATAVLGATAGLFLAGVISAEDAFAGFSNPAPITIAGLYIIAAGVTRTGALEPIYQRLLPERAGLRRSLARITVPAGLGSAVMANTPIVAMSIPRIRKWALENGQASSKYFIPLSYAAILGGTLTVIGTSTNLIVSGLMEDQGLDPIGLFEVGRIGAPVFLIGLVLIIALAPVLVPERNRPEPIDAEGKPYTMSMVVESEGPLAGVSVGEAGLRNLKGVFLVEVERRATVIAPVSPEFELQGGDRLIFAGNVDQIVDLQNMDGLTSAEETHVRLVNDGRHVLFEAVIGPSSPLAGKTLKQADFRDKYQSAVVAIHRSGSRVVGKLGQVQLQSGDTLLLLAGPGFRRRFRDQRDFLLVSRFDGEPPTASTKAPWALVALGIVVGLPALGLSSVLWATVLAVAVVVITGVLTPNESRDSVDISVVLVIGAAFGLGRAVEASGLGGEIADALGSLFGGTSGAVIGVILATVILTELITNAAAVALMFPIALVVAGQADVDPRIMMLGIAVAGSASFLTPIGYQTNTMVYGPGGYRFSDYLRLGLPLSIMSIITISTLVINA